MDPNYVGPAPSRQIGHWRNHPLSLAIGSVIEHLWLRGQDGGFDEPRWNRTLEREFPKHKGSRNWRNKRTYEELLGFAPPVGRQNNTGIYVNPNRDGYQGVNFNQVSYAY